jgi:hypothetical protein
MMTAFKQEVTVQTDGVLEIRSPEFKKGTQAEIIILLKETIPKRTLLSIIGTGKGCYATSAQADVFLQQERELWEK